MLSSVYTMAVRAATPLIEAHLKKRVERGREDPARANERHGKPQMKRPQGPLAWFHAASVGESVALLTTLARLRRDYPHISIMVTTGTVTSAKTMAERLPEGAFHQYIPVDHPSWVAGFLDHWQPDAVIWTESDFWPSMLLEIKKRKIPAVLLNGCMSAESHRKWRWGKSLISEILSTFDLVLAQNPGHGSRLADRGARNVKVSANLKYSSAPLTCDEAKLAELQKALEGRPVIVWGSSHPGEEEIIARIQQSLKSQHPGLIVACAPRHPKRGPEIKENMEKMGLKASLRSTGALPGAADDMYIADTMGEMGLIYRAGPLAIVGGSYCFRSHNPIEPAQLGRVVFYGPEVAHIESLCDDFEACGGALRLKDEAALGEKIAAFLANPESFAPMAEAAEKWTREKSVIVDEIVADLSPFLAPLALRKAS